MIGAADPGRVMEPTKSRTLVVQVADRIRAAIIRGELPSGEPLRQAELAARFGVSPTPLREALRLLEAERFVILHPFRGAVVTAPTPEELRELLEMFLALETTALEIGIPRLTEERLEQAEGLLREMRDTEGYEEWGALCVRLLLALCEPAGRPRLLETVRALLVSISRYWLFEARWGAHREGWERQAAELLDACRRRDVADAVRIFGKGTSTAVEGVIGQLEEREARLRPRGRVERRRRSSPPGMS
jgi:DNA-binding GntR family transcriptional regulator